MDSLKSASFEKLNRTTDKWRHHHLNTTTTPQTIGNNSRATSTKPKTLRPSPKPPVLDTTEVIYGVKLHKEEELGVEFHKGVSEVEIHKEVVLGAEFHNETRSGAELRSEEVSEAATFDLCKLGRLTSALDDIVTVYSEIKANDYTLKEEGPDTHGDVGRSDICDCPLEQHIT